MSGSSPPAAVVEGVPPPEDDEAVPTLYLPPLSTFPTCGKDLSAFVAFVGRLRLVGDHVSASHRPFLLSFSLISVDFLTAGLDLLAPSQLGALSKAAQVLTDRLLHELSQCDEEGGLPEGLSPGLILQALGSLCSGTPLFAGGNASDRVALTKMLTQQPPQGVPFTIHFTAQWTKSEIRSEDGRPTGAYLAEEEKESASRDAPDSSSDPNRPQTDLTSLFMGQFLTPLAREDSPPSFGSSVESGAPSASPAATEFGSKSRNLRKTFLSKNVAYMHQKKVGDLLIDYCSRLPKLGAYQTLKSESFFSKQH